MRFFYQSSSVLLAFSVSLVVGDYYGPTYPFPTDLSSNTSHVRTAWENISATFDSYYQDGKNTSSTFELLGTENLTFSAGLFSLQDDAAAHLQYHHTGPEVAASANGTKQVNGDSIYRTASITKLMTVLSGLLELTDTEWHRPVTDFIPELAAGEPGKYAPEWDKITPWLLANHLSGLESTAILADRLFAWAESLESSADLTEVELSSGLPPIGVEQIGPCSPKLILGECSQADFIAEIKSRAPVFRPNTTPAYSNLGIMVLGLVISRATNKPYDVLYNDTIFSPLGMDSSFTSAPIEAESLADRSVIVSAVEWLAPPNNPTVPSGGAYSTINDLDKFAIALLNSTLLPKEKTRSWMKPQSLTSSLSYAMGAPWEIIRYVHKDTGKVTDLYTKSGDSGSYGGAVVLVPDYDAGFTFLNAWSDEKRSPAAWIVVNFIAETLIPALEAQAASEATSNLGGTYVSTDPHVNSTIVVAFNESTVTTSASGLSISKWISNSTDMLATWFASEKPRLLLTIPKEGSGAGEAVFQMTPNLQWPTYDAAGSGPFTGFYETTQDLTIYETERYAGGSVGKLRFEVNEEGFANCVTEDATRLTLKREE
ncbi:hypothetical protein Q7P37_011499 [Cladosporium fusiforme]